MSSSDKTATEFAMASEESIARLIEAIRGTSDNDQLIIGHFGAVNIAGKHRTWFNIRYNAAVLRLLTNPDYKIAQILGVLGSEVRLSILRTLLDGPKTAAELVAELGFRTTGQAYHHLRELERAGYVDLHSGRYHFNLEVGQVYLTALALAADAGAESPEEPAG